MEGANTIAYLLPARVEASSKSTWDAIRRSDNRSRYVAPQKVQLRQDHSSRESTVPIEDEEEAPDPDSCPKLQLTFDNGPKVGQRFVIGRDPNSCDIVLPKHPNISRHHCFLTFDAQRRLILQDTSAYGTTVKYKGQGGYKRRTLITHDTRGKETRHHFTWILSGASVPDEAINIEITIASIIFKIRIPNHQTHPNLFVENVDRLRQREDELSIGGLGLQSTTSTAGQSEALTPRVQVQVPIYIDQDTLGTGFSSVDHIVHFVALLENPSPYLILEYLPMGNLGAQEWITDTESLTILCQGLDALTAVHEEGIVHRDVKPENILIQSRNPLQIKLSDFGMSKASLDLQTFCGTHEYAAPEIYLTDRPTYYTEACDIWSLGVVVFEYAYGPLPRLRNNVACVSPLDTPDHVSTPSLLSDREGLKYMVIRRHAVAMRKTDYRLDASQICSVAGLNKEHRRNYMNILKSHCHVAQVKAQTGRDHHWIPFKDGVFLCQALKLHGELSPLLSYASADIPREEENYFLNRKRPQANLPVEYKGLQWDDKLIVYMPSTRNVNATHLLKVHHVPRAKLGQFFSQNRQVSKDIVQGVVAYQGTYISFKDARLLCQHFHFSEDVVDEIARRAMTTVTPLLEDDTNADSYHHGGTCNADDTGTCEEGAMNEENPYLGLQHSVGELATTATHHSICTDSQASFQDAEPVLDSSHISYFTEPSYRYGSFLPPVNQSFLAPAGVSVAAQSNNDILPSLSLDLSQSISSPSS
ncbi:MAG: hypothetical protein Q9178_007665 [Gyalolechia marmorata]